MDEFNEAKALEQAAAYANQDEYIVTRLHILNLLKIVSMRDKRIAELERRLADCEQCSLHLDEVAAVSFNHE